MYIKILNYPSLDDSIVLRWSEIRHIQIHIPHYRGDYRPIVTLSSSHKFPMKCAIEMNQRLDEVKDDILQSTELLLAIERKKNQVLKAELSKYQEVKAASITWAQLMASGDAPTMIQHSHQAARMLAKEKKKQEKKQRQEPQPQPQPPQRQQLQKPPKPSKKQHQEQQQQQQLQLQQYYYYQQQQQYFYQQQQQYQFQ